MTISMDDVNQRYEIPGFESLTASLNDGGGLPAPYYFAPEIYRLEQEKIFAKSWSYACHESVVAKPGDYAVTRAGNVPIIVTHGRDGELRAFVNACRHRLHSLAEENGNKPLLQCPYHGWTYGLDGQLRTAPRADRERNFDCSTISLEPVAVERWDQWVFVNPDADAAPLAGYVSGIADRAATINDDLRNYEFQVRYEYDMDCNWKLWAENAVECYHCPTLHKSSFGKTYQTQPDDYEIDSDAHTIWHKAPIRWLPSAVDPEGLTGFRFAFTFPSSFFALDDYVGFVGSVQPVSPEKCWAFVDMYVKPGADPVVVKEWLDMWDRTLIEDKKATDTQQLGYNSGKIPAGRLMLDSESPLQSFTQAVVDALHA